MANSTYLATVNRVLRNSGQTEIADATAFNTDANLTKVQVQAKYFVDQVNRGLVRMTRGRWLKRKFTFNTADGDNEYDINSTTSLENLVQGSWFITTAGHGRKLQYITYNTWKTWFPEGESTEGTPNFWFDYPPDGTNVDKIGFSPPPSDTFAIQYEAYLDPVVLSTATDTIQWSTKWEDVIWDYGRMWLEVNLAEGKAEQIYTFLDPMYATLRQLTKGPVDKPGAVSIGMRLTGVRRAPRRYFGNVQSD